MNPRVIDNDHDTVFVRLNGRELRRWFYTTTEEQRMKMRLAREYVEGWCDGRDAKA